MLEHKTDGHRFSAELFEGYLNSRGDGCRRPANTLFLLGWALWIIVRVIQETSLVNSTLPIELKPFLALSLAAIFFSELLAFNRYDTVDIVHISSIALVLISSMVCDDKVLFYTLFIAYLGRNVPFKEIARVTLAVMICLLVVIALLAWLGTIPENAIGLGTARERTSLGFAWPSRAPNIFLTIAMLYVFLRSTKLNLLDLGMLLMIGVFLYLLTDSRNPLMCLIVLALSCIYLRCRSQKRRLSQGVLGALLASSFVVLAVISLLLVVFYDPSEPFFRAANSLMSNRLLYSSNALESTPPLLFGSPIFAGVDGETDPLGVGYLDSGYLRLLMIFGVVPFAITMALLTGLMWRAEKENDWILVSCLLCVAIHAFMEGQISVLYYTPFIFMCFQGGSLGKVKIENRLRERKKWLGDESGQH